MDPRLGHVGQLLDRLPRASGDGPGSRSGAQCVREAAPRERGWTRPDVPRRNQWYGCPARAGMDPQRDADWEGGRRLPRASGDGPENTTSTALSTRAAPRERGWTQIFIPFGLNGYGCPARAGMDPITRSDTVGGLRAAPRERGWTRLESLDQVGQAGCPARAGMDPVAATSCPPSSRLPRASGDGPQGTAIKSGSGTAAPRERGWTRRAAAAVARPAGCPARAGMDPWRRGSRKSCCRLPRASGDGPHPDPRPARRAPAAPRERGWTHIPAALG